MGLFTETGSAEARAQQSSIIVSQIPRANVSSGPQIHKPPNMSVDVGNNYDTALSDFNVQVRIERSIIRDDKPLDEETATEQGLYTPSPSKSEWYGTHGGDG